MMQKSLLIGLIILLLTVVCLGITGCWESDESTPISPPTSNARTSQVPQPAQPKAALTTTEAQVVSSEKGKGIQGSFVMSPEAKGKIELTHEVSVGYKEKSYSPSPKVKITSKNISNSPFDINGLDKGKTYNAFSLCVISKDKSGKPLGNPEFLSLHLAPQQVDIHEVDLFMSDETKQYTITLDYRKMPTITGSYSEASNTKGKTQVSHSLSILYGRPKLNISIKNISGVQLGWLSPAQGDRSLHYNWIVSVKYKDPTGKLVKGANTTGFLFDSVEEQIAGFNVLSPGKSYDFSLEVPEGVSSYEIYLYTTTGN